MPSPPPKKKKKKKLIIFIVEKLSEIILFNSFSHITILRVIYI